MPQAGLRGLLPDSAGVLAAMLDPAQGPVQAPIRSEIFGPQRFAQHGRSLGATHRAERPGARDAAFFPRLRGNIASLRASHRHIAAQAGDGYDISPAAEWLLDNFHLIEAQLKEIREGLPRSYYRTLPVLQDEPLAGLPRVYGIAWAFVAHTDGAFDEDLLEHFLGAYQETRALTLAEMWALPTTLRVVLVENLRRLAERVATHKAARALANLCCDALDDYPPATLDALLAQLERRGVGEAFLAQIGQRLQDQRMAPVAGDRERTLHWLAGAHPELAAVQARQPAEQSADNLSVSNAVNSLRAIGDADWPTIIGHTSALMRLLLGAPSFAAEHASTRDDTLHAIERLALRSRRDEADVAQTLLALMRADGAAGAAHGMASYWLQGPGRPMLLRALGLHADRAFALHAWLRRCTLPAYLGTLLLGSTALVAWLLLEHGAATGPGGATPVLAGALLMLFPASEAVVAVINRLISESVPPRHLPRLALAEGIPAEHRVMVVVPAMLTSPATCRELAHRLLLHYLANPERHAQFALLSDWVDADTEHLSGDAALLREASDAIDALNRLHPADPADPAQPEPAPRFLLLHRARTYCATERRWIGWERKRGKLELLLGALAQGSATAFLPLTGGQRIADDTRYLVTLDSDTGLPPGRLREMVGVAAHPGNLPRLDPAGRRVVAGYGILQPRTVTPLPALRDATWYHWLFAGQSGIDPYSAASSEVYQDMFGEGTFTGKGLLHVQAVHAVLGGRLPEGQVLSHDLLEGSLARCAAVTDIALIEEAPFHADVAMSRVHRWIRGDWQLLPFLLRPWRYPMAAINRWKMFDNLRRSLVAPMSLLLLLLALAGAVVSPWAALLLVLAAFSAGPLMGAVAAFAPSRDDVAKHHFYLQAGIGLWRALAAGAWLLAQLLQHALEATDATTRALYRMLVSRRHLLQWTTAATAQAQARTGLAAVARRHASLPPVALVLLTALLAAGSPTPVLALGLCLLWGASPLWTWWASRPGVRRQDTSLTPHQRAELQAIAHDTWRFFERCVGADDNHLPPDNLQTTPHDMVAHRTSPTNIGMYLLSAACARAFGWIDTAALVQRLEATLTSVETLAHHRGHLLNWYDTQTRAPLLPMYVSTVDSGNFSGHLLAVGQACLELARQPAELPHAPRLRALAARCEQIAWQADFSFLYHRRRHLFHIGYRVAEQQLDASFYDLLASESRLTSLLAIAKGDVPVGHWAALGRPFFAVGANAGLRSWSGSMFEYLMPTLVLHEPHGSVLRDAGRAAVAEQLAFAQAHGVPWGMSESAYAASDHTLAYQYAPQGVPRLALRRTPPGELVVAPYATALAAQIAPRRACANFAALQALAPRGPLGFIEALDFSPARQSAAAAFTPVSTYMAHHQGMSIAALANTLLDDVVQRWGMANPYVEAVASLLHERAPREVSALLAPPATPGKLSLQRRRAPSLLRELVPGATAVEPTHVLSNGRYTVTLRANGAGWSRLGQTGISRWRDDALRDACGSFLYLRHAEANAAVSSLTQHPAPDPQARYESTFHADRVCFDTVWSGMRANTTVWVSPEDDIELRQVELHNLGDEVLEVELMSQFDASLSDPRADEAHPAFTNLFVAAEWQPAQRVLVLARTPRLDTEPEIAVAHFLADTDPQVVEVRLQTDRLRWLGRNRAPHQPLAGFDPLPEADAQTASGPEASSRDTGLDPVCALSVRLRIAPDSKATLTFATAASTSRDTLRAVVDKYRLPSAVQRASLMSATLSGIRLRSLALGPENFAAIQTLTTALVLSLTRPAPGPVAAAVTSSCDRRLMWRFGLSGERPLILVWAGSTQGLGLVRSLAQALKLWSWSAIACDLVVVNAEPVSYLMALQRDLAALREQHIADVNALGDPVSTSLHLLRADELSPAELDTLRHLARVQFSADGRPLLHHVQEWCARHAQAGAQRLAASALVVVTPGAPALKVAAPEGTFDAASGDFRFDVHPALRPARPWINVLSNPAFGAQISEAGAGFSWAVNSRNMQLTAWSNDPVADPPSEWFLLQDLRTGTSWSATPNAWGDAQATYHVAHGQGHSTIRHRRGDLDVSVSWCVDLHSAVKQVRIRLINRGHRPQPLRLVGFVEWMMGANRADRGTTYTSAWRDGLDSPHDPALDAHHRFGQTLTTLSCTQRESSAGFGAGTAFFALAQATGEGQDWTCDRREFFDASGRLVLPERLGRRSGEGLDPCAALSTRVELRAGETLERVFLLGYGASPVAARQLALACAVVPQHQRSAAVRQWWDELLGATSVQTPDPLFDAMTNRWLLYQTVACRMWAKAGFYQAGGATGFRDQLQDALALAWAAPDMLRQQILLCATRQYPEGDVQHWWHAPLGAGVRTHFSDDLLWLPHACVHYLRSSGDTALLDEVVPFIEGAAIPEGAEDAYYTPAVSEQGATVYEHGARAIDRSLRVGVHGLPLMGSGDWNDGMNQVGIAGHGESVWLGWFLWRLVMDYAPLAHARGDTERALRWQEAAHGWHAALLGPAWDGQWFKRAFFDDGQPLGSHANAEARIDLIAQAWAVLSGAASVPLQRMALAAVEEHLMDHRAGLLRLLDPPLRHARPSAGYIQAYPPGVRENGGQYSHAGVWALMAQAELANTLAPDIGNGGDLAYRSFTWLSPAHRTQHPRQGAVYGIEPYVMAGDVYSQPPYVGRGGWSWYTGSAAWMHRAAIESLFGLHLGADTLHFTPCLPSHWPEAALTLRRTGRRMHFTLLRAGPAEAALAAAQLDARVLRIGEALPWTLLPADARIVVPLLDQG